MKLLAPLVLGLMASACASTPAPARAQTPSPENPRTVSVNATASVRQAPDRAVVRLGVETLAARADEASARNAAAMSTVLAALDELGIDRNRIQTVSVSLAPRFRRDPGQEPVITGYQATNRIRVEVEHLERVGPVVDAAVTAGANRVLGIQFELADPEAAYHRALEEAIARAGRDARIAADALGQTLGAPLDVRIGNPGVPAPPRPQLMRAEASGTPIQAGELEVQASVSITYRLQP